jgi:hypothetical protein
LFQVVSNVIAMAFGKIRETKKGAYSFSNDFIDEARSVWVVCNKGERCAFSRSRGKMRR